jgi:hypothetical protein
MKKEELKKQNIMEARSRFQKLYEYSFYSADPYTEEVNEADEEPAPDAGADPMAGGDPNAAGGAPGGADPMAGGDPNAAGGAPGGADPMAGGDPMNMGGDPNAAGDAEGGVSDPMAGMENQMDGQGADPMAGGDPMAMDGADPMAGGDEEVIDVDDLTDAQEKTYDKLGSLSKKFDKLLNVIDKFEEVIQMNDEKIDALEKNIKAEIEKRNPTAIEKLNLRSQNDSYPFNVSPTDYWKQKEATSNYRVGDDMEEDGPQYKIYQADIDEVGDWRSISQTLEDDDYKQTLNKILNF